MYVTDLTHFLDAHGAIAPRRGPARKMAEFLASVVAHATASHRGDSGVAPTCVKCRGAQTPDVATALGDDGAIAWHCAGCGESGTVSNWQGTAWDATGKPAATPKPTRRRAEPAEDLESFLHRQEAGTLAALLLELAAAHEDVAARLERMRLADRPDALAAQFRRTLAGWRRSKRFLDYREAEEFARDVHAWLAQIERELLPKHPAAALSLFEGFIEADASWFERADDSNGTIGDTVREACRCWLQAAAACTAPPGGWAERIASLYASDDYGARDELLRQAHLVRDEPGLRALVARLEARLAWAVASAARKQEPPREVFRDTAALSLLSEALRDPDIHMRATLKRSPEPNALQRLDLARAYLDADRPQDALTWLEKAGDRFDDDREDLLATAFERLGRSEESSVIRKRMFERSLSPDDLGDWTRQLPESAQADALAHAHALAMRHPDVADAADLLLHLGDAAAAEQRLLDAPAKLDGQDYIGLVPLAKALHAHGCLRGETLVYRALLTGILDRAYSRAYRHGVRYLARLAAIAAAGADLAPLTAHQDFEAELRLRHKRKLGFWSLVGGSKDRTGTSVD